MKNMRWTDDYSKSYKSDQSYLFKTFNRPKGFKRAEDPGEQWTPPSDLCFLWAGTLGKLFRYSQLDSKKQEVMRKYSIWVIESTVSDQKLFELFERAHDNIWNAVDNNGVPTVPTWKILRILEHYDCDQWEDKGNLEFKRN